MLAFVVVVLLLVLAPAAVAKEISKVEVCGRGDCNVLTPGMGPPGDGITQRDLMAFSEVSGPADPPAAAVWFRVRVTMAHDGVDQNSWTDAWVPSAGLLRTHDETGTGYTWFTVPRDTALSFRKVTRMLEPLPASTLVGAAAAPPHPRGDRHDAAPSQGGGVPWGWIVLGLALAGLAAALLWRRVPRLLPD